jgi:hypothetical protein
MSEAKAESGAIQVPLPHALVAGTILLLSGGAVGSYATGADVRAAVETSAEALRAEDRAGRAEILAAVSVVENKVEGLGQRAAENAARLTDHEIRIRDLERARRRDGEGGK